MIKHNAFREYYTTNTYRGFRKVEHCSLKKSELVRFTFSNGEKRIEVRGNFVEQALSQAFKSIDAYYTLKTQQRIPTKSH